MKARVVDLTRRNKLTNTLYEFWLDWEVKRQRKLRDLSFWSITVENGNVVFRANSNLGNRSQCTSPGKTELTLNSLTFCNFVQLCPKKISIHTCAVPQHNSFIMIVMSTNKTDWYHVASAEILSFGTIFADCTATARQKKRETCQMQNAQISDAWTFIGSGKHTLPALLLSIFRWKIWVIFGCRPKTSFGSFLNSIVPSIHGRHRDLSTFKQKLDNVQANINFVNAVCVKHWCSLCFRSKRLLNLLQCAVWMTKHKGKGRETKQENEGHAALTTQKNKPKCGPQHMKRVPHKAGTSARRIRRSFWTLLSALSHKTSYRISERKFHMEIQTREQSTSFWVWNKQELMSGHADTPHAETKWHLQRKTDTKTLHIFSRASFSHAIRVLWHAPVFWLGEGAILNNNGWVTQNTRLRCWVVPRFRECVWPAFLSPHRVNAKFKSRSWCSLHQNPQWTGECYLWM